MSSTVRLSVVCNVGAPYSAIEIFRNISTLAIRDLCINILRRSSAEYSDVGPNAISRKRCKIGGTLVLITNRKSHMSFRLVPNSVTLDDLERRNRPDRRLFHRIRLISARIAQKWLKIHRYFLQRKCRPQKLVFSDISLMAILAGSPPARAIK